MRLGCVTCHSSDGIIEGRNGPTWKGLFGKKRQFSDGSEATADDAYLRESIFDPPKRVIKEFFGKDVGMPSYTGIITEDDFAALVLYIRSLR